MATRNRESRTFYCIDLRSFFASVESVDRGLDPLRVNLAVADPTRGPGSICLAITPPLKRLGVKNRCRLRDIPKRFGFITAPPRMRRYIEVSAEIYGIYLEHIAPSDIHLYSIDECFIDATSYLQLYQTDALSLAKKLTGEVLNRTGISATVGIGTNLFLAKVALDILAKHSEDGIGILDEERFKEQIWFHRPITDVWQIGSGVARRLEKYGVLDLAGVAALNPATLRREFGVNSEYLIDHAWGQEPCQIADIHNYRPLTHSLSNGQVLPRNYSFSAARIVLREMVASSSLELVMSDQVCSGVSLGVSYAKNGSAELDYGPAAPRKRSGGSRKLPGSTSSAAQLTAAVLDLYDETTDPNTPIRKLSISLNGLLPASHTTLTLLDDVEALEREQLIQKTIGGIKNRFGANAVFQALSMHPDATGRERNRQIGGHRA